MEFARSDSSRPWYRALLGALLLALVTAALYWPCTRFGFVNLDDFQYIANNPTVQQGLTFRTARWALTTNAIANWHPLTWLSYLTDISLSGLSPGALHRTNVLLHAGNAALLALVLSGLTRRWFPALAVAGLFAFHPVHVESVAWISERKDVLSMFLLLLTLGGYLGFVRNRDGTDRIPRPGAAVGYYLFTALFLCLGLMAKSMLVTTPALLLLLDYWPLNRLVQLPWHRRLLRLGLEKVPLLIPCAIAGLLTWLAQRRFGATASVVQFPLSQRLANALIATVRYLWMLCFPTDLTVFYPYPSGPMFLQALGGLTIIVSITVIAILQYRTRPWLLVGWLWFAIALLPVIGLVQVGSQSMADRYIYVPFIGLYIAIVWTIADAAASRPARQCCVLISVVVLSLFSLLTRQQILFWSDSRALWTRAISVTDHNWFANLKLAEQAMIEGRNAEALSLLSTASTWNADNPFVHRALGELLLPRDPEQALAHYRRAVEKQSAQGALGVEIRIQYAAALDLTGRKVEAEREYRTALELDPAQPDAHANLASLLAARHDWPGAIQHYQAALAANPDLPTAREGLRRAQQAGNSDEQIKRE